MAQPDNISNLYNAISGKYDLGTEEQFRTSLKDAKNRSNLYNALSGDYDLGSEDDFNRSLGYENTPMKPKDEAAEIQQPTQQAQPKQQGGYKPTEQEMMAYGMTAGQAKGTAANATKGIENLQEGIKKASPVGDVSAGVGHNTNVRKGKQSFNAETGKFEDTYMTTDGQQYKNAIQADNAQGYLDRQKNFHQLQDAIGLDDLGDTGRSVDDRLKDAYNERKFLDYEINKRGEQLNEESRKREREKGLGQRILEGFVGAEKGNVQDFSHVDDSEYQNLQSAKRLLDRRITALEAEKNNSGFWRGTWDELKDPSNYSFGLTDLSDAAGMQRIKAKLDSGASLTSGEKTLVRNYLMNQDAQQLDNNRDWWYGAGKGFGQTLSFMKDFALTGGGFANIAKAGMRTGGKIGTNVATKALGEYMTKNLGTKVLGKTMEYIGKGAGLAAGAEAGGFLLNNSVQAASSTADIINKNLGKLTINKDGKLDFEEGKSLGNAILQSEISRTGENASELVGLGFDAMPGILGRVIQNTAAGKIAKRIADNKIWKGWEKGMNYLGVQSVWGEGLEEEYNMARTEMLNQLTDGTFEPNGSGLFDWEQQLDTWKTVGLTSMILRVPSMVVSGVDGANYYGNKYNLNTSDRQMRSTFGDESRYNAVKSMLDGADNQKIAGVLNSLMNNAELSTDEKKATMMYANDLIALRGFNIGNVVAAANGYKAPPKVANYSIRGLHVDEIDREGNVINSYDYENADALKSGLYELQQQRYDNNLQSDISVMKARPNGQYDAMVKDFCEQAGVDPSEFDTILSKPSLERTEAEQQMVAPFADLLHNTVYDNTMLHEEQSQQDGEEMADSDSIDIDTDNHNGATLNAQWQEAQGVRQQMFDNNEILKEEVESMEKNGLSPQEILSRIEPSASPKEVQGMIDYYNTKAKYEGYINRKAEKIDEEAANSRQRHTFKGTIDGVADVNNVHTITDGTNRYFLVSGNVTTDPATGNITGSSSGLIIGMDLDGSFVQLNEDDGYRIEPVSESLDQFEDAERTRLQEQVTSVIDPNGTTNQAAPVAQSTGQEAMEGGAAGEAGAEGTGGNEPAAAPVYKEGQAFEIVDDDGVRRRATVKRVNGEDVTIDVEGYGEMTTEASVVDDYRNRATADTGKPAGETAGTAATIESVTGEDGVKRYEQGVDMDTAIQDMEADGLDVKSEADLAINEAQEELGKIKAPKTRAERVKNEARRRELQGIVDYYSGLKARYDELHPNYADATPFIDQLNKATSKKKADEILNQALQAGVNPVEVNPVHSQRVSDILAKEEETRRRQTEITDADRRSILENGGTSEGRAMLLDKKRVPSAEKRRKLAKEIYGDYFDDDFDAWRDVKELISMWLGKGRQLDPDSFGQALGWDMGVGKDAAKVSTMFAKRRENGGDGMLFNDFVHMLWEASEGRIEDDRDISNAVIDMFQSAQEKSDLTEYQLQNRIAEAEARIADELRAAEEEAGQMNEEETETPVNEGILPFAPPSENEEKPAFLSDNNIGFDRQGNPVDVDGKLIVEKVSSIDDISNEDFENPARTIELPKLPEIVNNAIGANGKPVIIKKNIFERNKIAHSDLTPEQSREILTAALYTPDLYGQNQKTKRAYNWVVISTKSADGNNRLVLLEINENKDNVEIVHWHYLRDEALETLKRQAEREGGQILILPSDEEAGGLSSRTFGMSSDGKDSENSDKLQEKEQKSLSREDYLTSHPLTEAQIMADTEATEDEKLNAIDFLRGEDNSAISRFYYDGIYNRAQGAAEIQQPTEQQPIETNNPMEAIEQAANSFKEGKAAEVPLGEHGTLVIGGVPKREAQKAQDQKDIDAALKEFNGFLDGAKGSNVLDKFMRKGIEGNDKAQANLIDAFTLTNEAQRMFLKDLLRLASKVGYAYIKSGVHDAQDWSKKMADSIGKKLKEVLGWDDGIVGEFVDEVWNQKYTVDGQRMRLSEHAERLKNDKAVNVNKEKSDEEKKDVTLQEEAAVLQQQTGQLEGDSAEFAERQYKIEKFGKSINEALFNAAMKGDVKLKTMQGVKALAKEYGLEDISQTDLQELVETEIVNVARDIAGTDALGDEQKFEYIKRLYESQPTLSARDNDRINKQQYSTPAPMAFLMGKFLGPAITDRESWRGLEPSAGNGMLTINLPKEGMHVNDIDEMRLSNLEKQGFGEVTSQDALMPFDGQYDVVVTNPPFGNVTPKVYDGIYEISGLEHQMAINALESMKDDGRAAIIIGGNTDYNTNGSIKGKDRIFLNYLYAHYNVVDVINMNGHALYTKQGTGYPVRMILINGRKEFDPKSFAPVQSKARAERVESYDELFKRVNDDILRNKEHNGDTSNGVHTAESGQNGGLSDNGNVGSSHEAGVRGVRSGGSTGEHQLPAKPVGGVQRSGPGTEAEGRRGSSQPEADGGLGEGTVLLHGRGNQPEQSGGSEAVPSGNEGREVAVGGGNTQRLPGNAVDSGARLSVEQPEQKRELGTEKVPYRKQSTNPFDLQSQMPAEQADVVKKALEDLGDVDQFLVDELGYSSKEELYRALAAEQIDSVALAIHQMKNGDAFIIGDQTGIGKGRQGAALIRWAVKNGKAPVYFTAKPELFSSVYRDIKDIHSDGLRPFILASDKVKARITERNKDGKDEVLYDLPSDKEQKRVLDYINKNGKLPPEYDFMITTYSQVGNGTLDYENGQKKARSYGRGKSATKADINGQSKRDAIENLAGSSIVIMDESHLAGGASARGNYLQYITTKASGITYISATFAKRPDNMPLYSLRTAISKAGVEIGELIEAVKRGGATFQEIMSKALTEAGQMIRRERDMRGVSVDWKGIEDEEVIKKHHEQYDKIVGLFNDIISFQRAYVDPIVNGMNDAAAEAQGAVDHTPGTRDMGINNTPFASQTHNLVKQVLLSLKAEEGAKFAVECLKNKEKPVICVENTNEGAADRAVGDSEEEDMVMPDLSTNLQKGLEGTLRIQATDAFGNKTQSYIPLSDLSEEGQRRYHEIEEAIEKSSTGLSLSPIDVIKNIIRQAGYSVAELTGRKKEFVYNPDGTVKRLNRTDTDNKKNAADFNSGKVDAVIINKSAGTGIDLHAGIKFDNTDQRHMITVQAQSDINDEVQMRGRTDRTGQKQHSKYTYIVSTIPSEQRLLMMLKSKLRSLDANTTSSQKSKFNEMQVQDIINKYGDEIVIQYLAEHPETYAKLADPLKWGDTVFDTPVEALMASAQRPAGDGATASKVLGRMALLTVKEQEKMLAEIGELYQAEIDRLNEMGENDLEITEMPLRAKTLSKAVWESGVDPGGKNPFADNTYVEKVSMDVLKKPMKADEVKKAQERLLRPAANATGVVATWEDYKERTLEKVDKWAADKIAETRKTFTERAEKKANAEKEKYAKAAKKNQAKNGMTDAEIEKNADIQYDNIYNQEMEKLNDALAAIEAQKQVFVDALEMFSTDGVYAIPSNIYDLGGMTFEPSFGKLIDIKISDNFSTAASTLTFATLDGRRKITVPISGKVKQQNGEKRSLFPVINTLTAQTKHGMFGSNVANTLKVLEQNTDNWDKLTSTATRKEGYIITGNLLKALVSTREQRVGGKLISFTTDTGEVRQGILMPDNFEPAALTSKTPISAKKDELKYSRDKVESADGDVVIKVTNDWDWSNGGGYNTLELSVPKSTKRGGKYFNDATLLSLMKGQFEGSGKMKAEFKRDNLDAVLKRLDELGVTVAEEHKTDADPMRAISKAANSWREEKKQSELQEIKDFVDSLPKKYGLNFGVPTYVINSREDIDALKGKVNSRVYREIERLYNDPDTGAAYIPRGGIVVMFGEHLEGVKEAENVWWHEQAHAYWRTLPDALRKKYGEACFVWLEKNRPDIYNHIRNNYPVTDWRDEACAYLIGDILIFQYGTEKIVNNRLVGNEEICNFANGLVNHVKNGKERNNQLRRTGESQQGTEADVSRGDTSGRERGDSSLRSEEEQAVDPLHVIEESAKRWKRGVANSANEENSPEYSAKQVYHDRINNKTFVTTEAFQDAMLSLKNAVNAIAKDKDVPDSQNPYMAENLMHGKVKNQMDEFNRNYKDPLMETIKKIIRETGVNYGDIDRYVYTKSGLERNREFFVRDWLEKERKRVIGGYEELNEQEQEIYDRMANGIETKFEDGDITAEQRDSQLEQALQEAHDRYINDLEQEWLRVKRSAFGKLNNGEIDYRGYLTALRDFIVANLDEKYKPEKNDYSGFRDMFGDEKGKYDEEAIIDEVEKFEGADGIGSDETVQTLWNQIRDVNRYSLERYREAGMRSDEQIDQIEQMFNFYVPMRGFAKETGEDMYQYMTNPDENGVRHLGGLLKHAVGRKSEAEYPMATMFAMAYKTISDCEQNLVNQKLYRLVQANPNDLIVLSDSWAVLNERTGLWEESMPNIPEDATEEEARRITLSWEEEMKELAKEDKARKIKGTPKFDYVPIDPKKKAEHVVEVRMNGKKKLMTVTGNPRLAQALNGQLRFKGALGKVSNAYAKLKNFMASTFTSWSPTFAMRNMLRDWTHFRMMLSVREGEEYARAANKYYKETLPRPYHGKKNGEKKEGMVELFKKYRAGKLDMNIEVERDFKDFMDNGGITGFVFMQKLKDVEKEIEGITKDMKTEATIGYGKYTISFKKPKAFDKAVKLHDKTFEALFDTIEAYNEAVENNARFATFRASRHVAGRTKQRSAYDAKEITVNFNRKGAGINTAGFKSKNKDVELAAQMAGVTSQVLGEGRVFFNATLQAIATTFKNFRNPDGSLNKSYIAKFAGRYASIPFALGFLMPVINYGLEAALGGGDDDDPYANLPDWVRRNNICLYVGNNNFITIPVGQELAAFLSLGDIAAGVTYKPELLPVDKDWLDEVMGVLNTFSPIEIEQKVTEGGLFSKDWLSEAIGKAFSVITPIISVQHNRSWTGRAIYRADKNERDKRTPEYQKAYSGTNPVLMTAAKELHELGGGTDKKRGAEWSEWNPGVLQYLWEQYTGGPSKTLSGIISIGRDAIEFGKQLAGKEGAPEFNVRKIEGVKAFIQQGDERTQFYRTKAKFSKYEREAKRYLYENNITELEKRAKNNDPEAILELGNLKKGADFTRADIIREANHQDKRNGKIGLDDFRSEMYKMTGKERKEAEKWYNKQVKELVNRLDGMSE